MITIIVKTCCWIGHSGKADKNRTARANTTDDSGKVTARYCTAAGSSNSVIGKVAHLSTVSPFDYEACNRTVCNWYAGDYICSNYAPESGTSKIGDWGLPSKEALDALESAVDAGPSSKTDTSAKINIQKFSGANGLQLCQAFYQHNNVGSPRCDWIDKRCYGYGADYCNPHYIWGKSKDNDNALIISMGGDSITYNNGGGHIGSIWYKVNVHSVRCVLEKYIE